MIRLAGYLSAMDDPVAKLIDPAALYERDFYAWTQRQAALFRARQPAAYDWDNIAEEIESLGRSEQSEIENRIEVLLHHLLKWQFQPAQRSRSWLGTIDEQRRRIEKIVRKSPSLKPYPSTTLDEAYADARAAAAIETGLAFESFPADCPYAISQVLDREFLPGPVEPRV